MLIFLKFAHTRLKFLYNISKDKLQILREFFILIHLKLKCSTVILLWNTTWKFSIKMTSLYKPTTWTPPTNINTHPHTLFFSNKAANHHLKMHSAGRNWFFKPFPQILACEEKTKTTTTDHIYSLDTLSLIHIWRCRRTPRCRSRWSPYH